MRRENIYPFRIGSNSNSDTSSFNLGHRAPKTASTIERVNRLHSYTERIVYLSAIPWRTGRVGMFTERLFAAIAFLSVALGTANGAEISPIAGIYSDLYYNDEGGDLLGTEIRISKVHGRYRATVEVAEGVPGPIFVAPVDVFGNRISFIVVESPGRSDH